MALVWRSGPRWTIARGLLVILEGVLPLLGLYITKLIFDAIAVSIRTPGQEGQFAKTAFLIALLAAVTLVSGFLQALESLLSEAHSHVVIEYMTAVLHARSIDADIDYYENPLYADTLHRAQQVASFRPTRILSNLVGVFRSGVTLAAMAGLLLTFHWVVAAILFLTLVPGLLVRLRFSRAMYHWERERTSTERRAGYYDWILTSPFPAKEIRLFDLGSVFVSRFRELRGKLRRERLRIGSRRCLWESVSQVSSTLGIFGSYVFIAYRTVIGTITIGDLNMYFRALQLGQTCLREMLSSVAALYEDSLFLLSLEEFLNLKPQIVSPSCPRSVPSVLSDGIVFENVTFKYPSGSTPVFENVSLTIPKGEMVALVGENGCGKTTLVKLLCRLYDPTAGRILLDGVDLREFAPSELRRLISVVFQEYGRYYMTARENIWIGDTRIPVNDARIEDVARLSGADEVISQLSSGYETPLGKEFEHGQEISVGEWQKIALARAYLREAQLLVLDEPTSALDAKAEFEVFSHLRAMTQHQTSVVISHRFSTVRLARIIYVIEAGRIVEHGSHNDLMGKGGSYARLFQLQAQYYQ